MLPLAFLRQGLSEGMDNAREGCIKVYIVNISFKLHQGAGGNTVWSDPHCDMRHQPRLWDQPSSSQEVATERCHGSVPSLSMPHLINWNPPAAPDSRNQAYQVHLGCASQFLVLPECWHHSILLLSFLQTLRDAAMTGHVPHITILLKCRHCQSSVCVCWVCAMGWTCYLSF